MRTIPWVLLGSLILAQICYPLLTDRAAITMATVVIGVLLSVSHALITRGRWAVVALVGTAGVGGFLVEAVGVATGFPFGTYDYSGELGPKVLGVPLIIPLAWTWMAWPAWLAAVRVTGSRLKRIALAAFGLACWDLFLDPQMVAEGYWSWHDPVPALPGLDGIPISNYLGWLGFAVLIMTVLSLKKDQEPRTDDQPMYALWIWTYASSVLAHLVFLDLPASAAWGGITMSAAVLPLVLKLRK
ncbi:putative membrane protein [Actinoplanes couchii]|uniref:Membrane protein n=1 Tax=Actinoplanes couchii TaxID=403638 RepID=A0ABQ3X312_9ACTN|nr:putative membrane protein [Actinoplanes couchii]GID52891.1 membrane protein [Actinoplanes couchii]